MSADPQLQAAFDRIEKLGAARGFAQVSRTEQDGHPALSADGVTFGYLTDAHTLVLRCPLEQKALLLQTSPTIYFDTKSHMDEEAILTRLDRIDDEELSLRLEDARQFCLQEE